MAKFLAKYVSSLPVTLVFACAISAVVYSGAALAQTAPSSEPMQLVVVPKLDLEKGCTPTESNLEEKKIELRLAPVNAVSGVAEVVGRTLKRKKFKGSIILIDDLARPGDKLD